MEQITLIKRNGSQIKLFSKTPFCVVDSARQSKTLMGDDTVTLSIVSKRLLTFEKGDYIEVDGEVYSIRTKTSKELQINGYYKYDPVFYGIIYDLMKSPYRDMDANGKSSHNSFELVYTLKEFIQVIINNTNADYPGLWVFDAENCPDTEPVLMQFSNNNCLTALQSICKKFEVDFRATQADGVRTLHVGKFGSVVAPPDGTEYFEYGKGRGLYALKEDKVDDKSIKNRLWVEGGTSNLAAGYRNYAERLQLPYPQRTNTKAHTLFDGTVIEAGTQTIGITDESKRYIQDDDLVEKLGVDADMLNNDDIVPTRTGSVTSIDASDINSFIDTSMDFDLNKYLIGSTSAKITFTTGLLANQQFELTAYDATAKKFTLKPYTDKRGLKLPTVDTDAFRIGQGDKYKITDITMPDKVVADAEEALWYWGYDKLQQLKQPTVQYTLSLNRITILDNTPTDSDTRLFSPGDYVPVKDTRFGVQKNIRIQKVDRDLLRRHSYTVTISDTATINIATQTVLDVIDHENIIIANGLRDLNKAKRGWRTTEELRSMIFDTDDYFDTDNIRPNSIDTNMLTVGTKSQQFILQNVVIQPNLNGNPNIIAVSGGSLIHLTIDETKVRTWTFNAIQATLGSTSGYYLYARCGKNATTGSWIITQTQYKSNPDGSYYYFLVGVLGSVYADDNFRDFTSVYGFTRINGRTITTGRIQSQDKGTFLDLDYNKFKMGDADSWIDYNNTKEKAIILHNVSLLSGSGDTAPIGLYRGVYNSSYIYYKGDEVSYTYNGYTATYRYINPVASKGHAPTDSTYWSVVAKGTDGTTEERVFQRTKVNIRPTAPATSQSDGYVPTGWTALPVGVTSEYPFEWVAIRKKNAGIWSSFETPTIWMIYGNGVNGNLLNQTEFESADKLDKWHVRSQYANRSGYDYQDAVSDHIAKNYKDGYNAYYDTIIYSSTYIYYKEILAQYVWKKDGTVKTLENSKWYTLSFWVRNYGATFNVYLYTGADGEYAYDSNESIYVDGIEVKTDGTNVKPDGTVMSTPKYARPGSDMCFNFDSGSDIVKHTITFKTRSAYSSSYRFSTDWVEFLFRLLPPTSYGNINLCMVKLEEGMTDTAYIPSSTDLHNFYYEYRYAKNGSRTQAPDIDITSKAPTGWTPEQPTVGDMEYLWQTVAKKNSDGSLAENWSTPIRITPYDGKDGDSPALVYRGVYDATKTYYGNANRVDAVKYNGTFYVARKDAGSFTNTAPTDTKKWNTFGAEFESIATNLLLAEGASIGNWWHSGGKIVSTLGTGSKIELDASTPRIYLEGSTSGGSYSEQTTLGSKIELNADVGTIEVKAKNAPSYSTGTAYMSPTGIFANLAGTQAVSSVTGYTRRAAMVALGYGNVSKSEWELGADEAMIAGVYGTAKNNSNAPAYGGYFYDLKACGFLLYTKYIGDSSKGTDLYIGKSVSQVIGVVNKGTTKNVYLPNDGYEGRVILFHQMGGGALRIYPQSGQVIYDDTSQNDYYDCSEGHTVIAIFSIWYKNSVKKEIWCVRRISF